MIVIWFQWYIYYFGVDDSHLIPIKLRNSNVKSNYKLDEDQSSMMKSILHPYEMWTTNDQVHYLLLWLACFFISSLLAWEHSMWETTWIPIISSLLGVACFLDQSFSLLQLSISNVPRITTSTLAFQTPHLVYLHISGKPLH